MEGIRFEVMWFLLTVIIILVNKVIWGILNEWLAHKPGKTHFSFEIGPYITKTEQITLFIPVILGGLVILTYGYLDPKENVYLLRNISVVTGFCVAVILRRVHSRLSTERYDIWVKRRFPEVLKAAISMQLLVICFGAFLANTFGV